MRELDMTDAVEVPLDKQHWLAVYRHAKEQLAHFGEVAKTARAEILDGWGHEVGTIGGAPVFQRIKSTRRSVDLPTLREDHPKLCEGYVKEVETVSLRLVGPEDES